MAKNSMTFNASLRLNSKEFRKGVSEVQRSLKSLQSSFLSLAGALGLGLSFSKLGSSLLSTARDLSVAENTLKNVSKEFGEYGQNLEWLRKISNEYGQDMITLIKGFAQFRAAAASSKLSLEQMRDIYEALTRASGAFHLSSQETNNVMLAVTQMLSKGKVAAEELRRQLGNTLPGAFNLMAQAAYNAGVITKNTTAALEEAMKAGKVSAEVVLPEFAKMLNEVTANAEFESLQTSMNRLKNSWTEMVSNANFEGMYKGIIDGANSVVKFFSEGFWPKIAAGASGIFAAFFGLKGIKGFISNTKDMSSAAVAEFNKIYESVDKLDIRIDDMLKDRKRHITKTAAKALNTNIGGGIPFFTPTKRDFRYLQETGVDVKEFKKLVAEYNEQMLKLDQIKRKAGAGRLISAKDVNDITKYNEDLKKAIATAYEAPTAFKTLTNGTNLFSAALNKVGIAAKTAFAMLKTAIASVAIGAIISGITYLIGKLIEARREAKRLADIAPKMEEAVNFAGGENSKTLIQLTRIKRALQDINTQTNNEKRAKLISDVNKALGLTGDKMLTISDDINTKVLPAIDDYINGIKAAAKQQAILSQVSEATSKVIQLEAQNAAYSEDSNFGKTRKVWVQEMGGIGGAGHYIDALTPAAQKLQNKIDKNNKEIAALNDGIDRIIKLADEGTLAAIYGGKDTVLTPEDGGGDGGDGGKTKKATPESIIKDYTEELKKLENRYKAGAILAADYKNEVEKLNQKAFEELSDFGWDNALKGLKTNGEKAIAENIRSMASAKLLEGLDDPQAIEELDRAMDDEAKRAYEKFKSAWDKFIEYQKKNPVIEKADNSDWYMYSNRKRRGQTYSEFDTHYNNEDLKNYEKYVDDLESYKRDLKEALKEVTDPAAIKKLNELLEETLKKLGLAKLTVQDLKKKANIAQLEKEIADLKKQGIDSVFSSITSLSDGMDRLYRAVQSVQQINDSTWESEELENFLTRLNAIIQTFEVLKSIYEALQAASEVYTKIKEKNTAKAIALNGAEAVSEAAKGKAAAGAAAAGAASSVASIPWVGPALAVAAVAGVVAAILAGMKKFATGGFVGGNSYTGDKQIARVNSGELILNPAQQRNLLAIANGKSGNGGKVEFEIRGDKLVGAINNYNRLRGK